MNSVQIIMSRYAQMFTVWDFVDFQFVAKISGSAKSIISIEILKYGINNVYLSFLGKTILRSSKFDDIETWTKNGQ